MRTTFSASSGPYSPLMEELKKLQKKMEGTENDITQEKKHHAESLKLLAEQREEIGALHKQKGYLQDQLRKAGKTIKQLTTDLGTANDELTVKTLQVDKLEKIRKQVLVTLQEMKDDLNNNNKDENGH